MPSSPEEGGKGDLSRKNHHWSKNGHFWLRLQLRLQLENKSPTSAGDSGPPWHLLRLWPFIFGDQLPCLAPLKRVERGVFPLKITIDGKMGQFKPFKQVNKEKTPTSQGDCGLPWHFLRLGHFLGGEQLPWLPPLKGVWGGSCHFFCMQSQLKRLFCASLRLIENSRDLTPRNEPSWMLIELCFWDFKVLC